MQLEIVGWAKFNPRQDLKHVPWIRIESNIASSRKLFGLTPEQKWFWVYLLSLAGEQNKNGLIDAEIEYLAHFSGLECSAALRALERLEACGLVKVVRPSDRIRSNPIESDRVELSTETHPIESVPNERTNETNGTDGRNDLGPPGIPEPAARDEVGEKRRSRLRFTEWDMKAAVWMQDRIKTVNPDARRVDKANLEKWANEFRLMREQDELAEDDISNVLGYTFLADSFWRTVVQSPANLRENWDKITAKMNNPQRSGNGFREAR